MTKTEYWIQCELSDEMFRRYESAVYDYGRNAIGWYEYESARSAKDREEAKRVSMWLELCKQKDSNANT